MRLVGSTLPHRSQQPGVPLRQKLKFALTDAFHSTGMMRRSFQLLRRVDPSRRVVVLIYHKVVPAQSNDAVGGVSCEHLESQVRVMRELFACVSADAATAALDANAERYERYPLLFTFDDGYQNNLQYALPILSSWKVPSIVFVPTGLAGTQQFLWTDEVKELLLQSPRTELRLRVDGEKRTFVLDDRRSRLAAASELKRRLKRMPHHEFEACLQELRRSADVPSLRHHQGTRLLSWSSVRRLRAYGAAVGSHSSRHYILSNLPEALLEADLQESQQELEKQLGVRARCIAYPNGHKADFNEQVFASARRTGIVYGFTMEPGIARQEDDPMQLPRIAVRDEPGPAVAFDILRLLARDLIRQEVRRLWRRPEREVRAPPRLVVVDGEAGQGENVVPMRPPLWRERRDVASKESA